MKTRKKINWANKIMGITFKSLNIDGQIREWHFDSAKQLEDEWNSENCDVPANDDPIWDVYINGRTFLPNATYDRIENDPYWFEDLLTALEVDIWQG